MSYSSELRQRRTIARSVIDSLRKEISVYQLKIENCKSQILEQERIINDINELLSKLEEK